MHSTCIQIQAEGFKQRPSDVQVKIYSVSLSDPTCPFPREAAPIISTNHRCNGISQTPKNGFPRPLRGPTWWEALDDGLVVHLEGGVATATRKANHVVLAVVHGDRRLIYGDVICAHIEDHTHLSLFLYKTVV